MSFCLFLPPAKLSLYSPICLLFVHESCSLHPLLPSFSPHVLRLMLLLPTHFPLLYASHLLPKRGLDGLSESQWNQGKVFRGVHPIGPGQPRVWLPLSQGSTLVQPAIAGLGGRGSEPQGTQHGSAMGKELLGMAATVAGLAVQRSAAQYNPYPLYIC